ncbi:hypothetical protein [Thermoflavifilum thermophilum]|uniref:Uncharacterized protein n=1 Tax=Thermoflavifilum thermophilum TaxID=1393122 RepID=A0A1I7N2M5_9BACT|nr:hypothetical protein [Thermoflavifilum thermophilum]SFV28929.1 hypothetical protein SAMN05660895_0443 [Thermoflavifilum thermophilum]
MLPARLSGERRGMIMYDIEPFYNWRHLYAAEEDEFSIFYGRQHDEFHFTQTVYNYYIHPQWDSFGAANLYLKVLFADYDYNYAIIEMMGEWNDCIENDIMTLKRKVIDHMIARGIYKFILITENIFNFHASDDCYYQEWWEDVQEKGGWIAVLNMPEYVAQEFNRIHLYQYIHLLEQNNWRTFQPQHLFHFVDNQMIKMLSR